MSLLDALCILGAGLDGARPVNALNAASGTATDLGRTSGQGQEVTPLSGGFIAALNSVTPFAIPVAGQGVLEAAPAATGSALQAGAKALNLNPHPFMPSAEIQGAQVMRYIGRGGRNPMDYKQEHYDQYNNLLKRLGTSDTGVVDNILRDQTLYENTKLRRQGNTTKLLKTLKTKALNRS